MSNLSLLGLIMVLGYYLLVADLSLHPFDSSDAGTQTL